MKKIICLSIALMAMFITAKGQQKYFNKTYDFHNQWDIGWDVIEIEDSYIVGGSIPDSITGAYCLAFLRIDTLGNVVWKKSFGRNNFNYSPGYPSSLIRTSDGGYALGGAVWVAGNVDAFLMKFDQNFDTLWTRSFGDTAYQDFSMCRQLKDSSYILVGTERISNDYNVLLIKTDKDGNLIWKRTFGNSFLQRGLSIDLCYDQGFIIGCSVWRTSTGNPDAWIIKTDSLGNMLWNKYSGSVYEDYISSTVIQTSDSGYLFSMKSAEMIPPNPNPNWYKVHICKLSYTGSLIWEKLVGPFIFEGGNEIDVIHELNDGNFIAAGQAFDQVGMSGWLFKFDSNGDTIWSRTYGYCPLDYYDDYLRDMKPTADGGFIMAGFSFSSSCRPTEDIWAVKVDSEGCGQSVRPYGLTSQPVPTSYGAGLLISWLDSALTSNQYIIEKFEHNPSDYWNILNSSLISGNSFKDTNLFTNTVYCYRVTAIDVKKNISCPSEVYCFSTVNISEYDVKNFNILLFPNPADDYIKIKMDGNPAYMAETFKDNDIAEIKIFDILGQQVGYYTSRCDIMINDGISLDTDNYNQGIYHCNILIDNVCIVSKPFIIMN